MKFFNIFSLQEGFDALLERDKIVLKNEMVTLEEAQGRFLSEDIVSSISLPSFNRSTVDGYAVDIRDVFGASETFPAPLSLIGEVEMGSVTDKKIARGTCIYVPTGGMIPDGATGMVMIEECEKLGNEILISRGVSENSNMILEGDEVKAGQLLISKNTRINSSHIGVLASIGKDKIEVYEKMRFSIISTGDEIVSLGTPLKAGEVYDINTHMLSALIREAGGEISFTKLVKDNMQLLKNAIEEALLKSHVVLISGGSSVGVRDFTEKSIEEIGGEIFLHGLAVKPGKPTICASIDSTLIFGLPGHPQSAANIFKTFVEPALLKNPKKECLAVLGENLHGDPGKTCFVNVKLFIEDNKIVAYPVFGKSSMIKTLMDSSGYVIISEHREGLYKGEIVKVVLNER